LGGLLKLSPLLPCEAFPVRYLPHLLFDGAFASSPSVCLCLHTSCVPWLAH